MKMSLKKRLCTLLTAVCLLAVFALPAFATGGFSESGFYYLIHTGDRTTYLNLEGAVGTSLYCRKLCLYRTSAPGQDQKFKRLLVSNGMDAGVYYAQLSEKEKQWYCINKSNTAYGSGYDAIMWPVNAQNYEINDDSLFEFPGDNSISLRLEKTNLALTYPSAYSGAKIYFSWPSAHWDFYLG